MNKRMVMIGKRKRREQIRIKKEGRMQNEGEKKNVRWKKKIKDTRWKWNLIKRKINTMIN